MVGSYAAQKKWVTSETVCNTYYFWLVPHRMFAQQVNLLSICKYCLAKVGYLTILYVIYIAFGWFPTEFHIASNFAKMQ